MKNINFIKTGMENFCCYKELMEYEFKNNKVILITGPNGAGKSSMFASVQFSLFGETDKGARSSDLINNTVGKNCHTYLEFTSELNGILDNYRVDRYVKHSKFGDTVLLFKNDMTAPYKKGQKEVLPEIEKILIPQKLFTNTLLFGQKVKDFFTDLPDSDRKEIFRKVLQLDNYVMYQDETNKRIKQVTLKLDEIDKNIVLNSKFIENVINNICISEEDKRNFYLRKNEEINSLTQKINQLKAELSELNNKQKLFDNINDLELNDTNDKISSIQSEIEKIDLELNSKINALMSMKSLKESEFNNKSLELISTEKLNKTNLISEETKKFQEYSSNLDRDKTELNNNKIQLTNSIDANQKEIKKNEDEILKLKTSLNKTEATCPTCGKKLTDDDIKKHLTDTLENFIKINSQLEEENKNSRTSIYELNKKINQLTNLFQEVKLSFETKKTDTENVFNQKEHEITNKHSEAKEKLNTLFMEKKKEIEEDISSKKQGLNSNLNKLLSYKNNLLESLAKKKEWQENINRIQSDIELNKQLIISKDKEEYNLTILTGYISEKEKLEEEKKKLSNDKIITETELEVLNFWKMGFSSTGIPSLLIDESIPFLNAAVENYLEMVGGRYKASFDTISTTKAGEYRDKINVNVLDTQTKANNRKQLSGGQTRIIDIAILLSLCDLQNSVQDMKTNILLLDEIFDTLDDQNIGYVSNLLRSLVEDKSINIISHRHIDSIEADEAMRLF